VANKIPSSWLSAIQSAAQQSGGSGKYIGVALYAINDALRLLGDSSALSAGIANVLFVAKDGDPATAQRGTFRAFLTIQGALDAALPGDTIYVSPGSWDEHLIWPNKDDIHLIGSGSFTTVVMPTTVGPSLVTASASALSDITIRHIGFNSSAFNIVSAVIGSPATPLGSIVLEDVYAYGITVDNASAVTATQCYVGYQTNFYGCDLIDAKDCYLDLITDSFLSAAHPYGGTASRTHRFRSVQSSSRAGPAVRVDGCPIFDMDSSCTVLGSVDATSLAPATAGAFLPFLRFGAQVRVVDAPSTDAVVLSIGFVGDMSGPSDAPAGMDMSGCSVYGASTLSLPTPLAGSLNSRDVSFGATAAQLRGGLTVNGPASGAQYLVSLRACRIGWDAGDVAAPAAVLLAAAGVDIDARGCNLRNCALQATGAGAIDRDTFHPAFVASLAPSDTLSIVPPFPSYVGAVGSTDSYVVLAAPTSPACSTIAILPSSDHTHIDYSISSPAGGASFMVSRSQNN
jgi:hypothetical protein